MNYKRIILIFLSLFIILTFSSCVMAENIDIDGNSTSTDIVSSGNTIVVDGSSQNQMNEHTIQDAIDNAEAGDTIEITGTNYVHCHFIVDKPLNIISNVGTTMSTCPSNIKGSDGVGIFYFNENATGSTISGFTLSNDWEKRGSVDPYAIYINGASNIEIANCKIKEVSEGPGIYIRNASNIEINAVTVQKSIKGIYIINSSNINIEKSIIERNTEAGIYIGKNVETINIKNNTIYRNNWKGIYLESAFKCNITSNNISDNRNNAVQARATEGIGIMINSTMEYLKIRGNNIFKNGNYGILHTYLARPSIDAITNGASFDEIEEIDENFFTNHNTRGIFVQSGPDGGTYTVYVQSNFYAMETFCPSTYYEPGMLRTSNARDLVFSEIKEVEPGIYNISFIKMHTGEIAEYLTTVDVTFFLNKATTKAGIEPNDQAIVVRVVNGTATANFTDARYKSKGNTITVISTGYGPIDPEITTDRLSAIYNVPDSNIPPGTVILETNLAGNNITAYYSAPAIYKVILTDGDGTPLSNKTIKFKLNGHTYNRTTDENGTASMDIKFISGTYDISAIFEGDDEYPASYTNNTLTVMATVEADDLEKMFRNATPFEATIVDNEGNPLVGETVTFNINGIMYRKTTDDKGTARLDINLPAGEYTITALNPSTGEQKSNIVSVLSIISENKDIVKHFRNGTQYVVKLLDDKGNPIANEAVTFNINGRFYTRTSNSTGHAQLDINLPQGEYIITADYKNCKVSNNIKVLPIIKAEDLTKYYKNDSQFSVIVLDDEGNLVGAGKEVTFNINGRFYTRATDANGVATLNINLPPGNYIITSTYKGCNVANNIKVLPVLSADDLAKEYGTPDQFKVKLVDGQGNPYPNQTIRMNINGRFYERTTDENGVASLDINLLPGKYIITSSFNGANIANTVEVLETLTVAANLPNSEIQKILDSVNEKVAVKFLGDSYSDISLNVKKPILINGNGATLNGKLNNAAITINSDDVIVKNFNINANNGSGIVVNNVKNTILENNEITNLLDESKMDKYESAKVLLPGNGIDVSGVKTKIINNTISYFNHGIYLKNAKDNTITENKINKNNFGIEFDIGVSDTIIENNNISNQIGLITMTMVEGPYGYGISVRHSGVNIKIIDNLINENYMGIFLDSKNSSGIVITGNEIRDSIIEGLTVNENYTPATGATLIVENNALYNNAKGPSLMILGEVSANPAGIYGPGEWDDNLKLTLGPNWYGTTLYTTWGEGNTGPGTICPRIKTTLITCNLTSVGYGRYAVVFLNGDEIASELPDFTYYFTLNAFSELQKEVIAYVHEGKADIQFPIENFNSTGNIIEGSSGSLFDSERPFKVTYTYNVPDSD